jgi:N-acetylmuramoyl-L-alanine amidase
MRVKGTTIQQVVLGLALLAALCWNLAQANEINRLDLDAAATGTRAELHLQTAPTSFKAFTLRQPDRLVVDLVGVDTGKTLQLPAPAGLIKSIRTGRPAEATTRIVFDLTAPVSMHQPKLETGADGVRLVLEWPGAQAPSATATSTSSLQPVAPTAQPSLSAVAETKPDLVAVPPVVRPVDADPATAPLQSSAPRPAVSNQPASNPPASIPPATKPATTTTNPANTTVAVGEALKPEIPNGSVVRPGIAKPDATRPDVIKPDVAKPDLAVVSPATAEPLPMPRNLSGRPLVVAIDAGHGGQDPGAIGPTGKREKDVTLAIARELARQVNATPGLKAVLTRDSDMFLPLTRRGQLARQAKADIFISIHADAAENRSAKGSSVYVLSLRGASSQRARWLADKENAADLIGGHPLPKADNTLTSVLLDLTQSGQMRASESAAGHVLGGLKDIGYNHKPNIERANFAVLRTSDMPAMLVETAFISNPDEERRLTDPSYQRSLARAVLAGVDTYFRRQPPPGTLYAARAKAAEASKAVVQNAHAGSKQTGSPQAGAAVVVAKAPAAVTGGSPD